MAFHSQKLMFHTQSNMSDIINDAKLILKSSGDVVYHKLFIAIASKGKQLYTAIVNVVGIVGPVDALNVTFSELDFFNSFLIIRHICSSIL